jgi:hypothetical protein
VEAFVLVVPERGSEAHRLAERIVRALSGLSPCRLILVRVGEGVEPPQVALRILKIAARAEDGAIVTLGRSGGVRFQESDHEATDPGDLWDELDQIEARAPISRPS